jgi:hypothetical protein
MATIRGQNTDLLTVKACGTEERPVAAIAVPWAAFHILPSSLIGTFHLFGSCNLRSSENVVK